MLFHSFMANYMDKIIRLLFCGIFLLAYSCQNKGAVKEGVPQPKEESIRTVQVDSAIIDTASEVMVQEEEYSFEYAENNNTADEDPFAGTPVTERREQHTLFDSTYKSIHIFVALCDNENQGIVKVPASIGNGQKPSTNLYWGCGYGIKTFFKKLGGGRLQREAHRPMHLRLSFQLMRKVERHRPRQRQSDDRMLRQLAINKLYRA